MKPFYVRLHARDNVAIIANPEGVSKGTQFACGLTAVEAIPQANKVALSDLAQGEPLVRYGEIIGHASRPIARGSWVREDCVTFLRRPRSIGFRWRRRRPPRCRRSTVYLRGLSQSRWQRGSKKCSA